MEPRAAGGSRPPAPPVAPTPRPLLPPMPPVATVSSTGPMGPPASGTRSNAQFGCYGVRGNPIRRVIRVPDAGKGKGPARKQSAGGGGGGGAGGGSGDAGGKGAPRMPSADAGAGAGAGGGARMNQVRRRGEYKTDQKGEKVNRSARCCVFSGRGPHWPCTGLRILEIPQ